MLTASAAPALAAKSCGKQVIDDWYDNGRVDRIYDLHCYRDAIKQLPVDVKTYSSAKEDIERALAFARQGKKDTSTSTPQPSPPPAPTTTPDDTPVDTTERESPVPGPGDETETDTTGGATGNPDDPGNGGTASGPIESSSDSLPLPLLVLGGLALLLLAAGSAGYLTRRLQARRAGLTVPPSGE